MRIQEDLYMEAVGWVEGVLEHFVEDVVQEGSFHLSRADVIQDFRESTPIAAKYTDKYLGKVLDEAFKDVYRGTVARDADAILRSDESGISIGYAPDTQPYPRPLRFREG